jgi:hypothetical protein
MFHASISGLITFLNLDRLLFERLTHGFLQALRDDIQNQLIHDSDELNGVTRACRKQRNRILKQNCRSA